MALWLATASFLVLLETNKHDWLPLRPAGYVCVIHPGPWITNWKGVILFFIGISAGQLLWQSCCAAQRNTQTATGKQKETLYSALTTHLGISSPNAHCHISLQHSFSVTSKFQELAPHSSAFISVNDAALQCRQGAQRCTLTQSACGSMIMWI